MKESASVNCMNGAFRANVKRGNFFVKNLSIESREVSWNVLDIPVYGTITASKR